MHWLPFCFSLLSAAPLPPAAHIIYGHAEAEHFYATEAARAADLPVLTEELKDEALTSAAGECGKPVEVIGAWEVTSKTFKRYQRSGVSYGLKLAVQVPTLCKRTVS